MSRNSKDTVPAIRSVEGMQVVHSLSGLGFPHHRIAALFDENQGRVADAIADYRGKMADAIMDAGLEACKKPFYSVHSMQQEPPKSQADCGRCWKDEKPGSRTRYVCSGTCGSFAEPQYIETPWGLFEPTTGTYAAT